MLKYSDLTPTQKRCIDAWIKARPNLSAGGSITRKESTSIYYELRAKRSGVKGSNIGPPLWLYAANELSRGVYQFPAPNYKTVVPKLTTINSDQYKSSDDEEFVDELRANGIVV